jgi:phosphoribosyl 1,2-cyclic phosphate phosphodiesterase
VQGGGASVLIDTPPDFREQALTFGVERIDAVLFTHTHADHVCGFDDIRRFNQLQRELIPAYGSEEAVADLKRIFNYATTAEPVPGLFRPRTEFRVLECPLQVQGLSAEPLDVVHGRIRTQGYLFRADGRSLGYVPDCAEMPAAAEERLRGVDVMILDGLRDKPHPTHLSIAQAVRLLERIGARRSYLTHMNHEVDHDEAERGLPDSVRMAYDGLTIEW